MKTGLNFFPSCRPKYKSAECYFDEALDLCEEADQLGYSSVKVVEHHCSPYGGYSPSPIVFLSAVAQRTEHVRLVTGAAVPAFTHPIRLAAELAMVDCMSGGRLDAGFARAFLPHEFEAFGIDMSESRARFEEGIEAIVRLWTEENVSVEGRFHRFKDVTVFPKPAQHPHPPVKIAAVSTPESFVWAGEKGFGLMVVPYLSDFSKVADNLELYRSTYREAHGEEPPSADLVLHLYVAPSDREAQAKARPYMEQYMGVAKDALLAWSNHESDQYKGYGKVYQTLEEMTFDRILAEGRALIGSPDTVLERLHELERYFGDIHLEVNATFGEMDFASARRSVRLYGSYVIPEIAAEPALEAVGSVAAA